jgi:hypothetical protein
MHPHTRTGPAVWYKRLRIMKVSTQCHLFPMFIIIIIIIGVRLSPLCTAATLWPIVLAPDDR